MRDRITREIGKTADIPAGYWTTITPCPRPSESRASASTFLSAATRFFWAEMVAAPPIRKIVPANSSADSDPNDRFCPPSGATGVPSCSPQNSISAPKACRKKGLITVGFIGQTVGDMSSLHNYWSWIRSGETAKVQEAHTVLSHIVWGRAERGLYSQAA